MTATKWAGFIGTAVLIATLTLPSAALAAGPEIVDTGLTAGQIINGTVQVRPTFADESAISRVVLRADYDVVAVSTTAPFVLSWNSRARYETDVRVEVVAYDRDGNQTISPTV